MPDEFCDFCLTFNKTHNCDPPVVGFVVYYLLRDLCVLVYHLSNMKANDKTLQSV